MAKRLVSASKLTAIGDAIREKTGSSDLLTLDQMAASIGELGGIEVVDVGGGPVAFCYYMDSDCTIKATVEAVVEASKTTSGVVLYGDSRIPTWSSGTPDQIEGFINAADKGLINIADYWSAGDERTFSIKAMAATGVKESHVAQDVTIALMDTQGLYVDAGTGRPVNCIWGLKNGLANGTTGEYGYIHNSGNNLGGWKAFNRRTWCNSVFYEALPDWFQRIIKTVDVVTADGPYNTTATTQDRCFLPAEKEIFGSNTYANKSAEASLVQWEYFETESNRIKRCGDLGNTYNWLERSPYSGMTSNHCIVTDNGAASYCGSITYECLIAPCGCF